MRKTKIILFILFLTLISCFAIGTSLAKYRTEIELDHFDLKIVASRKVFAVYGEIFDKDGNSLGHALNFYNRSMPVTGEPMILDDGSKQTVTEIYTGFDTATYSVGLGYEAGGNTSDVPWRKKSVNRVTVVDDGIAPVSTNGWFCFFDTDNSNFYTEYNLTSIDISKLDTSNVTTMRGMFGNCIGITTLDVSSLDTSNVTDMSGMFYNCNQLSELDLSNFDTSRVTTMLKMFASCPQLNKIYVSESWMTQSVVSGGDIFNSTSQLVGGAGTTGGDGGLSYARIDGGTSAPGYFTYKHYALIFEANGGTNAPEMMLFTENAVTLPLNVPIHNFASFLGWATTANAKTAEYQKGDDFTSSTEEPCCDILYAVWDLGITSQDELRQAVEKGEELKIGGGDWNLSLWDGTFDGVSNLTINDGVFDGKTKITSAEIEINGGTFHTDFIWCSDCTFVINGGIFTHTSDPFYTDSSAFTVQISGGKFSFDPTGYVIEGHTVVDNGDGTWTVQ